jgi:hypothetical protein
MNKKREGKTIPVRAWTNPEGSRSSRRPDFKTVGTLLVRFSALTKGHLYPQGKFLVLISVVGRDISDGIATRYRLDGTGIESR